MVKFNANNLEMELMKKIAARARTMAEGQGVDYPVPTILMDLEACHCNGCPLDLQKLWLSSDGTFEHDVFGIQRFLDRETGQLTECFDPRCSKPVKRFNFNACLTL